MERVSRSKTNFVGGVQALRLRILNLALLVAVAVGGLAYVRVLVDSIDLHAWGIAVVATLTYVGLVALLLARALPYDVRAICFLVVLYVSGIYGLLATGYLPTPILILVAQNLLASVLFGRQATWMAFGFNLVGLLTVGILLSTEVTAVATTTFYDPTDLIDWFRVVATFAVFSGIGIVSVDVLTRHLEEALGEQTELLANLRGAMQLHDELDRHRREVESRLEEAKKSARPAAPNGAHGDFDSMLGAIADKAELLRTKELARSDVRQLASEIEETARQAAETRAVRDSSTD